MAWATITLRGPLAAQKPAAGHARGSGAENFPQNPTFSHDVAAILYANCVQCHRPGGAGPISLITYEDAKRHARQIAVVTEKHFMPPWLPDPEVVSFADQIHLTEKQIRILGRWAEQGAAPGDLSQAPPVPQLAAGWRTGKPDLILTAPAGYVLPAEGSDVYHNFVFKILVEGTHYVKAVEIHPGNPKVVHHANILIDRAHSAERMEARHPGSGPGFDGMDVEMESDVFEPEGHFIYWKPGTPVWSEPENMTWRLSPGTDLVLNIHMRPSGKPEPIQPSLGIYFLDKQPTLKPMLLQFDRDDALDIPAGARNFEVADDFKLPLAVSVYAVYPHAHYLGKQLEAYAVLPDGSRKWLLMIRDWDPAWQGIYRYPQPVSLPAGTVISMHYTYDNSDENPRNPNDPPKRVTAGNRATDEMAHLSLQVVPAGPSRGGDLRLVLQEALARHKLARDPNDYGANYNLGALLLSRGQPADATFYFERSLTQRPDSATVLNSLGAALLQSGRMENAMTRLQQAVAADPEYVDAHYNLASALALSGRFGESAQQFKWVIERKPEDADAEARLGSVLAAQQNYDMAEAHLRRALILDPNNTVAKENLRLLEQLRSRTNDHAR
ncbi:MAG TPA: tetratricopeptide repeat protein [Terriglobales bacterium]|nr:tetratricopeptide repeat protein [Terriglobales bacterium]